MQETIKAWYDQNGDKVTGLSDKVWAHREASLGEFCTCETVGEFMEAQGFAVSKFDVQNLGGKANAVKAQWGNGKPVIGLLGEFDALPGLGQEKVPYYSPLEGPGHGCGHNLMASSAAGAASALKAAMEAEGLEGTIIYLGCPAEETLQGKVYLARDGYFNDMDLCLTWHPGGRDFNMGESEMSALTSILFKFTGKTSHAASAWQGRSALDAAELMSIGSQYLREHMTDKCRVHHVYHDAGEQPNIVPEFASIYFYIRSPDNENEEMVRRVRLLAEGAALMTETKVESEMKTSCHGYTYNRTLARYCYDSTLKVPPIEYSEEDYAFARELYKNVMGCEAPADNTQLLPSKIEEPGGPVTYGAGSTDAGEPCYILPTTHMFGYGGVSGLPGHHWSMVASAGTDIGHKAVLYSGKVLAQCAYDALKNPKMIEDSWVEFRERHPEPYKCRLV